MDKVLVTGSTGFVGKNLLSTLLNKDYSVIALVRSGNIVREASWLDYVDYKSYWQNKEIQAAHYIHLAGKAHDLKNISDELSYFEINYELTKEIYNRFLDDDSAKTFTFISSVKAVADEVSGELTEEAVPNPLTAYGRSKIKAEKYILENTPKDKTVVILRPCMIHGPGNKGNLNLLHSVVSKGLPWPLGAYENRRSFLFIDNLCYVIHKVIEFELKAGVYNVSDDSSLSTNDLVRMIAETSGNKLRILNIPKQVISFLAMAGNILPLPVNEERLQKLTESYLISNRKIKKALGIKKMPVSAREGMMKTPQSFQNS